MLEVVRMATKATRHDNYDLARRLIKHKLRTPIVHLYTGIPKPELREIYNHIHGQSPGSGRMSDTQTLISSRHNQIYISLFASFYQTIAGNAIYRNIDIIAVLEAYEVYLSVTSKASDKLPSNLSEAWIIARDIRTGEAIIHACDECKSFYLVAKESKLILNCPVCTPPKSQSIKQARSISKLAPLQEQMQ